MDNLDVLIISKDNNLIMQICPFLDSWKKSHAVYSDSLNAISYLGEIDALSDRPLSFSLIVDGQDLDLDPDKIASIIKGEPGLANLKLIYLYSPDSTTAALAPQIQGYSDIINSQEVILQLSRILQVESPSAEVDNIIQITGLSSDPQQSRVSKVILLAEQNIEDRRQLQNTLREAGHKIISVSDGDQALEALEHQTFDLAIINLELPVMNGTQVIRLHRLTTPYKQQVPFIVITGNNTLNSLRICKDLHVSACMFKPALGTEVLDRIDSCLCLS